MINECFIQYERGSFDQFIPNAVKLLFGVFDFVLENENINSKLLNLHTLTYDIVPKFFRKNMTKILTKYFI